MNNIDSPNRLNLELVRTSTVQFPNAGWQFLNCKELVRTNGKRSWQPLKHVEKKGGIYAFLFPEGHFSEVRQIALDGPAQRKIPFSFSTRNHPPVEGFLVAYVGKASNLLQRLRWHFNLAKSTTVAQVQFGLIKSGLSQGRNEAVKFMVQHGRVVYREFSGDTHVVNRDLLEMSLIAQFAPPFNIKSER